MNKPHGRVTHKQYMDEQYASGDLISISYAAKILGLTYKRLRRLIEKGEIPAVYYCGSYRLYPAVIEQYKKYMLLGTQAEKGSEEALWKVQEDIVNKEKIETEQKDASLFKDVQLTGLDNIAGSEQKQLPRGNMTMGMSTELRAKLEALGFIRFDLPLGQKQGLLTFNLPQEQAAYEAVCLIANRYCVTCSYKPVKVCFALPKEQRIYNLAVEIANRINAYSALQKKCVKYYSGHRWHRTDFRDNLEGTCEQLTDKLEDFRKDVEKVNLDFNMRPINWFAPQLDDEENNGYKKYSK